MGEVDFVLTGVLFQIGGVVFEALRLSLVQKLLSSEYRMDALVSIYYYAPVCAVLNFMVALVFEVPRVTMAEVYHVGIPVFLLNGMIAFLLNFAAVSLVSPTPILISFYCPTPARKSRNPSNTAQIGKTSAVVLTLCGVLKDILLVAASIAIWGTRVTPLQAFGYTIALAGIVYYKLGYAAVRSLVADAGRWSRRSLARRLLILGVVLTGVYFFLVRDYGVASLEQDLGVMGNSNKRIMEGAGESEA